jgi:hypothetical protein
VIPRVCDFVASKHSYPRPLLDRGPSTYGGAHGAYRKAGPIRLWRRPGPRSNVRSKSVMLGRWRAGCGGVAAGSRWPTGSEPVWATRASPLRERPIATSRVRAIRVGVSPVAADRARPDTAGSRARPTTGVSSGQGCWSSGAVPAPERGRVGSSTRRSCVRGSGHSWRSGSPRRCSRHADGSQTATAGSTSSEKPAATGTVSSMSSRSVRPVIENSRSTRGSQQRIVNAPSAAVTRL